MQPPRSIILRPQGAKQRIEYLSLETVISFVLKMLLLLTIPIEIVNGQYATAVGVLITLGVSLLPAILSRSLHINLPWEIDMIITAVVFAHAFLGYFLGLYALLPFFDKLLHFGSTVMISILSFMIYYSFYFIGRIRLGQSALFFFIVLTALGLGAFWEIIEYLIDIIFEMQMQNGLDDTMFDLIFDTCGGIVAAFFGYLYIKFAKPAHRRRIAIPISQLFGYLRREKADSLA